MMVPWLQSDNMVQPQQVIVNDAHFLKRGSDRQHLKWPSDGLGECSRVVDIAGSFILVLWRSKKIFIKLEDMPICQRSNSSQQD